MAKKIITSKAICLSWGWRGKISPDHMTPVIEHSVSCVVAQT